MALRLTFRSGSGFEYFSENEAVFSVKRLAVLWLGGVQHSRRIFDSFLAHVSTSISNARDWRNS